MCEHENYDLPFVVVPPAPLTATATAAASSASASTTAASGSSEADSAMVVDSSSSSSSSSSSETTTSTDGSAAAAAAAAAEDPAAAFARAEAASIASVRYYTSRFKDPREGELRDFPLLAESNYQVRVRVCANAPPHKFEFLLLFLLACTNTRCHLLFWYDFYYISNLFMF
jgi:hypothetical protein